MMSTQTNVYSKYSAGITQKKEHKCPEKKITLDNNSLYIFVKSAL